MIFHLTKIDLFLKSNSLNISNNFIYYGFVIASALLVIYYRFIFYQITKVKDKNKSGYFPPVTIIVCAKNELNGLKKLIPLLLNQKYPNYQILIINDHSKDGTAKYLNEISLLNKKVNVHHFNETKKTDGKKEALSIGISLAKTEWVILTDADCIPQSEFWITSMLNANGGEKNDIVLGIGYYEKTKGLLNKIIQMDTLLIAIQYLSFAKIGKPYMSVGRNVAYKKSLFLKLKGFENHMNINGGDDDLFVQSFNGSETIGIQLSKNSSTISKAKRNFKSWFKQKSRHISTGFKYNPITLILLGTFQIAILLFYSCFTTGLFLKIEIQTFLTIFVLKFFVQYIIYRSIFRKLDIKQNLALFFCFELLWVFLNFIHVIYKLTLRDNKW